MDEVHFRQHGSRCQMWVPPEMRDPALLHAYTHKSVGYWGAVRLCDGKLVYRREGGMFNKVTCTEFLPQFYRQSTRGPRRVVVNSDNAQYHHSRMHKDWRAEVAPKFELSFLPPASPDLNPIERVGKLARRRGVHNRYFPKLSDVTQTVEGTFEEWRRGNETLRPLCTIT